MRVVIEADADGHGLVVEDRIEQRQLVLRTDGPTEPTATDPTDVPYPIDTAATVTTAGFTIGNPHFAYLRDGTGEVIDEVDSFSERSVPAGEYLLEVSGPIKLYVSVTGPLTVALGSDGMRVELDDERPLTVGARSYHERPAATITTTADPSDLMEAVSALPSSLKTTAPERSFPTLHGHPPELELGDSLSIPESLEPPETGIHIEVPERLGPIFVVAPLAFYLGADVRPGPEPRLVTDAGWSPPLDSPYGFEREVERVLKQAFLLDCLTRTGSLYDIPLHELRAAESALDFGFASLYDASPAERLEQYLSVPYEAVAEWVPRWKLTAHVTPEPDSIETVPFLVDDLAVVRTPADRETSTHDAQLAAINEFTRSSHDDPLEGEMLDPAVIEPEQTDSVEQAWVGPGAPLGASKAIPQAFRNRFDREVSEGDAEIVVVCNDTEMREEHERAREVYGSRDELPFEVTYHEELTTAELRSVLRSDGDYLHYIGHIEADGIRCADRTLDVRELDTVGVDTFFLNGCTSYQQGMALIERGAIGGVVTLNEVINSGAINVGRTMTRLLNRGFPLRVALSIAAERSVIGNQYIVVGDGSMEVTQTESITPNLVEVSSAGDGEYAVEYHSFHTLSPGGIAHPQFPSNDEYYLIGSDNARFHVTESELEEFLNLEPIPVMTGDRLVWSDELELEEL